MSDPVSLASLFAAAEQAAVGGDFVTAARLLAEAARAQEASLGPDHLDLANTLNNLAVAHERCGQLDAAEREYRRAHAIAARALPADDPIVTTSAQNLRDFCEANGRPVDGPALRLAADGDAGAAAARAIAMAEPFQADVPTAPIERLAITFAGEPPPATTSTTPPGAAAPPAAPARAVAAAARATPSPAATRTGARAIDPVSSPVTMPRTAPAAAGAPGRRLSIPVLVAMGAIAGLVIWLLFFRGSSATPQETQAAAADTPAATPAQPTPTAVRPTTPQRPAAQPPAPGPAAPGPAASAPPSRLPAAVPTAAASGTGPSAASPDAAPAAGADGLAVGEAKLCRSLAPGYRCEAAGTTVKPGRLVFYTRLVATRDTSVVHRWYRGSELRQAIRLDVPARRQGFRTFSRGTVSASEGEWRVELHARDGRLLHTERFTVR